MKTYVEEKHQQSNECGTPSPQEKLKKIVEDSRLKAEAYKKILNTFSY